MAELDQTTESKIIEAAKKVFQTKGFDGARMQEIADEAGINKALLHYYFRSKINLFNAIFEDALKNFVPEISNIFASQSTFQEKINLFVSKYIDLLIANPLLPQFVLGELSRNPQTLIDMIKNQGAKPEILIMVINMELSKAKLRQIDPVHLFVNILGLCIFPFVARPILQGVIYNGDESKYKAFLSERKAQVVEFILKSLDNEK